MELFDKNKQNAKMTMFTHSLVQMFFCEYVHLSCCKSIIFLVQLIYSNCYIMLINYNLCLSLLLAQIQECNIYILHIFNFMYSVCPMANTGNIFHKKANIIVTQHHVSIISQPTLFWCNTPW